MAQPAFTEDPASWRALPHPLQYCPFFDTAVDADKCWETTTKHEANERFCRRSNCASRWRACFACVAQGTVSHASLVMSRWEGVCNFHAKHGSDAKRLRPLDQPVPPDKLDGAIALAIRAKTKHEGMTILEIAEEINRPPEWVRGYLEQATEFSKAAGSPAICKHSIRKAWCAYCTKPAPTDSRQPLRLVVHPSLLTDISPPVTVLQRRGINGISTYTPLTQEEAMAKGGSTQGIALELKKLRDGGMSVPEIAKEKGRSQPWVYSKLALLKKGKGNDARKTSGKRQTPVARRGKRIQRHAPVQGADGHGSTAHHVKLEEAWAKVQEGLAEIGEIHAAANAVVRLSLDCRRRALGRIAKLGGRHEK